MLMIEIPPNCGKFWGWSTIALPTLRGYNGDLQCVYWDIMEILNSYVEFPEDN